MSLSLNQSMAIRCFTEKGKRPFKGTKYFPAQFEEKQGFIEYEIPLVNEPPEDKEGYKCVTILDKVVWESEFAGKRLKSFHYDHYCFDSNPEIVFFKKTMQEIKRLNESSLQDSSHMANLTFMSLI